MAAMSAAQASALAGELMSLFSSRRTGIADLKQDFIDSVVAIDAWFDAQEITINNQFTATIKANATLAQKVEFFERIVQKRRELNLIG